MQFTTTLRLIACLTALAPLSAYAACYDHCAQLCTVNSGDLDLQTCTSRCTNACVQDSDGHYSFTANVPAIIITAAKQVGTIALSATTLESGHSFGFPTPALAEQEALLHCHDDNPGKPADCKSILTFNDSCAALATLPGPTGSGGSWGIASAPNEEEARQKAQASCKVMAEADCHIAYSFCSQ